MIGWVGSLIQKLQHWCLMRAQQQERYENLVNLYNSYGLKEQSLITQAKVHEIAKIQAQRNMQLPFKQSLMNEIWGQCQANSKGEAPVSTVCSITVQAMDILEQRLSDLQGEHGWIVRKHQQMLQKKEQLQHLQQYDSNNHLQINNLRKQLAGIEGEHNQLCRDQQQFASQLKLLKNSYLNVPVPVQERASHRQSINYSTIQHQQRPQLLFILHVSNICLLLQLVIMTYKLSFLNCVLYTQIYYLLFYGYQNRNTVKYLLAMVSVSILLDIGFIVVQALTKLHVAPDKYTGNRVFFIVVMGLLVVEGALRVLLLVKLMPFRNQQEKKDLYFVLWGNKMQLNKKVTKNRISSQIDHTQLIGEH